MSTTGDNGSWDDQRGDIYGQQGQQPPQGQGEAAPGASGQDPFGQQVPPAQGPYGQPSASDPYGQPGPVYGQQSPAYGPAAGGHSQPPTGDVGQSRLLVGLLGIFLGAFGVHRFLMGYTTLGIVQVCITVLSCGTLSWVSGIWGLVEGIMVLARSEQFQRDAHGRPLTD